MNNSCIQICFLLLGNYKNRLFLDVSRYKDLLWTSCLTNLVNLTIEKVQDFIQSIAVPECRQHDGHQITTVVFLGQCQLENIFQSMVYCWMKTLGFHTVTIIKHIVWMAMSVMILWSNEQNLYQIPDCLQVPIVLDGSRCQTAALEHAEIEGYGYSYLGTAHIEMWVPCRWHAWPSDYHVPFMNSMRALHGSLPIIIIGQDEYKFSQVLVSSKMWVGPHKESPLLPKSEGEGRMISGMQSRDFGFGLQISE